MKTINSVAELKRLARGGPLECAITLSGGLISRKYISYNGKRFYIENCIDDTTQWLNEKQLFDDTFTNIGKALKMGALVII